MVHGVVGWRRRDYESALLLYRLVHPCASFGFAIEPMHQSLSLLWIFDSLQKLLPLLRRQHSKERLGRSAFDLLRGNELPYTCSLPPSSSSLLSSRSSSCLSLTSRSLPSSRPSMSTTLRLSPSSTRSFDPARLIAFDEKACEQS